MGSSHDDFVKYPRTPHLFGSKGTDDDKYMNEADSRRFIADESLIVEEKIDGTNVGIHFTSGGQMVLQCRGHLITEGMHPQYDLFKQWTMVKRSVLEERLESRFILFGEQYRSTVTMMSGLPGSGKDTWLARNRPDLPVVSLDDIRAELGVEATDNQGDVIQAARERCRGLLRSGRPFAFSATNLLRQTRKRWIDLFADYGARIEIVYIEPPMPVVLGQNRRRERPVPENVIRELADKCEPPTWAEAHHLVLHEPPNSQ